MSLDCHLISLLKLRTNVRHGLKLNACATVTPSIPSCLPAATPNAMHDELHCMMQSISISLRARAGLSASIILVSEPGTGDPRGERCARCVPHC
jgi:hypothetical protein